MTVQAQIQTKSVYDFSGGLVNSLSNSLMQDNQATRLEDVDITSIGSLKARSGYRLLYFDTLTGRTTIALAPVYRADYLRNLYITRRRDAVFGSGTAADTGSRWSLSLLKCNDRLQNCSTLVQNGFWNYLRNESVPFGWDVSYLPLGAVLANSFSEPYLLRTNGAYPLRPVVVGQIEALALSGGGTMTGNFRYRYGWKKSAGSDTTRLGPPSWYVNVQSGKVLLYDFHMTNYTVGSDSIIVYREQNNDGLWRRLKVVGQGTAFVDTFSTLPIADTLNTATQCCQTGMTVTISQAGTSMMFRTSKYLSWTLDTSLKATFGYSVVYQDSIGRLSQPSGVSNATTTSGVGHDSIISVSVAKIPVPDDPFIKWKLLLRRINTPTPIPDTGIGHQGSWWIIVDTLDDTATTFIDKDTIVIHDYTARHWPWDKGDSSGWKSLFGGIIKTLVTSGADRNLPEGVGIPDSLLQFQPSSIASFNSRLFAAGNPIYPNYLYYSDFGNPGCWPEDHVLSLVSSSGDWINGLYSLGERLLIFRHNSIFGFTGANFYQFQLDEIANNVGLSGPRTLAGSQNEVFFAHQTGVYEIPRGGAISNEPISLPIQNSFDSTASSELTANGVVIGRDYWYSPAPTIYPKTYIYTALPRPHWKVYTIGVKSATLYDPDTTAVDFSSRKYILLNNYDHLLRWDYSDTSDMDVGGFGTEGPITPLYQSKYFFEGPSRTMVQYVDVEATGAVGTMTVKLVCNYGDTTISKTLATPDFSTQSKVRFKFGRIVKNAAVRIEWQGANAIIRGYTIGYTPWDGGKL